MKNISKQWHIDSTQRFYLGNPLPRKPTNFELIRSLFNNSLSLVITINIFSFSSLIFYITSYHICMYWVDSPFISYTQIGYIQTKWVKKSQEWEMIHNHLTKGQDSVTCVASVRLGSTIQLTIFNFWLCTLPSQLDSIIRQSPSLVGLRFSHLSNRLF